MGIICDDDSSRTIFYMSIVQPPFSKTARSLGLMGHAVAGWSAAEEMSSIDSVIISDTDLFPPEA